ncbi:hypothetical protein [Saprospira grandis]|uniref:hypothetical protein n=1 Tax=Saprospira grandis TaxID=1008 RepID=UPI0022DE78F2|nr:hypothetical protein [Saprospira grandis]WBM74822.1 hypothetical protein OP864_01010 [Saprospira grandis]
MNRSKNFLKRKKLFDKFSNQLHLLKENGLINIDLKYDKTYICPLCVRQFNEDDLMSKNKNFLTEEDAPPNKLKGTRIALTCKECNSTAGHQIDADLIHALRNLDDVFSLRNESQHRKIQFESGLISGKFTPKSNGLIEVQHSLNNNNPSLLSKYLDSLKNNSVGQKLSITPKYGKINIESIDRALLKTSYILTFAKFGYIFLLDKYYDLYREQIMDINSKYKKEIFVRNQFSRDSIGTYYVINPGIKSIFNIFSLKTSYSETLIGSIIPIPGITPEQIHKNLVSNGFSTREKGKVKTNLNTTKYDPNADLFYDINEIKKIVQWLRKCEA